MLERKLPQQTYESIPAEYIRQAIKNYRSVAECEEEQGIKDFCLARADTLLDLLKSWVVYTVAQEPDVIEAAQKAYRDAVDSFAVNDGEPLIQIFKD